jgi:hypothetical protein
MVPDTRLLSAVETLDYRVTVGDVAAQAGLDVRLAEQELLALASQVGGHLQVADTGDIVYLFPKNIRAILRKASLSLRLKALWQRIWSALFYLIRISFGIILILSLVIVAIAVVLLLVAMSQKGNGSDQRSSRRFQQSYGRLLPFSFHDLLIFDFYRRRTYQRPSTQRLPGRSSAPQSPLNFLEAVFSFLFGDGNPNDDLGDRRWRNIAGVIRNHGGAVTAEQLAPYLDLPPVDQQNQSTHLDDHMLPILQRFKGHPEVSPSGGLIYHFPALQVMAEKQGTTPVPDYLKEDPWIFSLASPAQRTWVTVLGAANLSLVVTFAVLFNQSLITELAQSGQSLVGLINAGYWIFATYAIAFLLIPTARYLWLRRANHRIEQRNHHRFEWANQLDEPEPDVQDKLAYARKFAAETVVDEDDLAYTTEMDLMTQELLNADAIDQDWQRQLQQKSVKRFGV